MDSTNSIPPGLLLATPPLVRTPIGRLQLPDLSFLQSQHLDLYIYATQTNNRILRNTAITSLLLLLQTTHGILPGNEFIAKAYKALPENSTLCNYLVVAAVQHWNPMNDAPSEKVKRGDVPGAFLYRVIEGLFRGARNVGKAGWEIDFCLLHEHANNVERRECRRGWEAQAKAHRIEKAGKREETEIKAPLPSMVSHEPATPPNRLHTEHSPSSVGRSMGKAPVTPMNTDASFVLVEHSNTEHSPGFVRRSTRKTRQSAAGSQALRSIELFSDALGPVSKQSPDKRKTGSPYKVTKNRKVSTPKKNAGYKRKGIDVYLDDEDEDDEEVISDEYQRRCGYKVEEAMDTTYC